MIFGSILSSHQQIPSDKRFFHDSRCPCRPSNELLSYNIQPTQNNINLNFNETSSKTYLNGNSVFQCQFCNFWIPQKLFSMHLQECHQQNIQSNFTQNSLQYDPAKIQIDQHSSPLNEQYIYENQVSRYTDQEGQGENQYQTQEESNNLDLDTNEGFPVTKFVKKETKNKENLK